MILLLVFIAVTALVCYSLFINKIKGLPPGPPPLPLLGNFLQFEPDMDKVFFKWRKQYGRAFTIWMPHPTVVITDHKLLQEHIVKDGDKFSDRINPKELMQLILGGEYGLAFNDNGMWKEQRRFALHALRDVGFNNATIQEIAIRNSQEIIARWKIQGVNKTPVDLTQGMMVGVSNIIWHQTFGRTLAYDDPLSMKAKNLTQEFMVWMAHPVVMAMELIPSIRNLDKFFGSPVKKLSDVNDEFLRLLDDELELVKKNFNEDEDPKCYVDAFFGEMRRREAKGEHLGNFTHRQLVAACYDLWTAGFETTVTNLRFAFHYMINNPGIQRKAQQEIDAKIGKRAIQMEDQKVLHFCNAVIQEVLRLSNILSINFTRMVNAPVNIEGYDIPVGTGVIPEFAMVHMDPEEFERPDYFCPARHLNEQGEFVKDSRINPFSMGKRSCLGEGLARMELFLFFTSFIQHLTFSSVTKVPPELMILINFARTPAPYEVLVESRD